MFWRIEGYPLQFFLERRETDPSPDAALCLCQLTAFSQRFWTRKTKVNCFLCTTLCTTLEGRDRKRKAGTKTSNGVGDEGKEEREGGREDLKTGSPELYAYLYLFETKTHHRNRIVAIVELLNYRRIILI